MDAETFRDDVRRTISASMDSFRSENGIDDIWDDPLVGLADARSPLFPQLRVIAYADHLVPSDILPGARTVVSYFIPFRGSLASSNMDGVEPSAEWVRAYTLTNRMAVGINSSIVDLVEDLGHRASAPVDIGQIGTYSRWSQRHVARIAGLGSFGMNNMLISEKGCCGRYYSVVTDVEVIPDSPFEEERCTFKRTGRCGICMRRCVGSTLGAEGFDRDACNRICSDNEDRHGESVCGKCVVGLPCSHRSP